MKDIAELQKQIANYSKHRECYKAYKASGKSPDFYETHREAITLHEAAKRYFDKLGKSKLPSITMLKQEYATVLAEKKKLYVGFAELKDERTKWITAKVNTQEMLKVSREDRERDNAHDKYTAGR